MPLNRETKGIVEPAPVPSRHFMTAPNVLTLLRIVLTPILLVLLLTRLRGLEYFALAIYLIASATDWLDGFLARRRGQASHLGALLDPLADKVLNCSVFIAFVELKLAPAWMVAIIVAREVSVTGIRGLAVTQSILIRARSLGKSKMVLQVVCISAIILGHRFRDSILILGKASLWGVVILSTVSMSDYIWVYIRETRRQPPPSTLTSDSERD